MELATGKPRLLIIDDEASNLGTFRRVFRKDYEMSFASSVDEALAIIEKTTIDLALVDYSMPNANGIVFLRKAKIIQPALRCLMLTAHADLDDVIQAHTSGLALGIVIKPWTREVIEKWVQQALRLASMQRSVLDMKTNLKDK